MFSLRSSCLVVLLTGAALVAAPAQAQQLKQKTAKPVKAKIKAQAKSRRISPHAIVRVPEKPTFGQLNGLHGTEDPLDLKSSVALVMDQDTHEILLNKNAGAVLPIASITKLMTAVVVSDAQLPMDETLQISQDDIDTEKGTRSRLSVGTELTRGEMMHLALMASENRAAHALGRHYPGGLTAFVAAMNRKAKELGMDDTNYVEPTGLSSRNQSSAKDLATLVDHVYKSYPVLRELSTSPNHSVALGKRNLQFKNTNRLVNNPAWEIGVQKTGYISEAGQCLVMQAKLAGRKIIMVFLDSTGKLSRIADAERVRKWLNENASPVVLPAPTRPLVMQPLIPNSNPNSNHNPLLTLAPLV